MDASLAKLQTTVLDAVAPLVHIMNEAQQGTLSVEKMVEAAKTALSLLGNASTHVSRERRKKAILSLNKKLHPLVEEEDVFAEAAPLLLSKVFETKMKAHLESLKCLSASRDRDGQNFWQSHLHYPPWGSGTESYRGRGGYHGKNHQRRFQPYNAVRGGIENQRANRSKN